MKNSYFISTAIPYVNSKPHVGTAQEFVLADVLARSFRQLGHEVYLQSGTDDNAFKNVLSARVAGVEVREFVDRNAESFRELLGVLNCRVDGFVRTSSAEHASLVGEFLGKLRAEDIYDSAYSGLYCQGCEDFYLEADLINGLCPDHLRAPELIDE